MPNKCMVICRIPDLNFLFAFYLGNDDDGLIMMKDGGGVMCINCGKTLSTLGSGRRHIREKHRYNQRAQCIMCKREYKNMRCLQEHLSTTHGVSAKQLQNVIRVPHDDETTNYSSDYVFHNVKS